MNKENALLTDVFLKDIRETARMASDAELIKWKTHVANNRYNETISDAVLNAITFEMSLRVKN